MRGFGRQGRAWAGGGGREGLFDEIEGWDPVGKRIKGYGQICHISGLDYAHSPKLRIQSLKSEQNMFIKGMKNNNKCSDKSMEV